jgi:carboxyl-terminal processing protease
MRTVTITLLFFIISPFLSKCQTTDKAATEAFVLTRMVNKFHVEPRNVNDSFSVNVYNDILNETDEDKTFFTKDDISRLSVYTTTLDDEIKQRKTGFLNLFTSIYQQRLKQADSLMDEIGKKPFDFNAQEKLTVAEDTTYPQSLDAMKTKLYKKLKLDALDELVDDLPSKFKSLTSANQKKYIDSAEPAIRKKVVSSSKRKINNILQNPYGMVQYVGNIYCEKIALCFDPHSEYFPPAEKENFESELGKQPFRFGFRMKADKAPHLKVANLIKAISL